MKIKKISIILAIVLFSLVQSMGQCSQKLITVGDREIELQNIDLKKGLLIESHKSVPDSVGRLCTFEQKAYRNFSGNNYAIAWDTATYQGYGSAYHSAFSYFSSDGKCLFSKAFKGVNIGSVDISDNGKRIIVHVGSVDEISTYLFDSKGDIITEYINIDLSIAYDKRKEVFYLQFDDHPNEIKILNTENDSEKHLVYNTRASKSGMSPSNKYFIIRANDSLLVFDKYGTYQWGLPYENKDIYLFSNGDKYVEINPYPIGKLEVRQSNNHQLLYRIDGVVYNNKSYPVYKSYVIDNTDVIWVSYYIDKLQVFNFIDSNGKIINMDTISSLIPNSQISFVEENGKFKIIF